MTDREDAKKPDAARALFGSKEPPEPPKRMYVRDVRHVPGGTSSSLRPSPEGEKYLTDLARYNAEQERIKRELSKVPRAPLRDEEQQRKFKEDLMSRYAKKKDKDKGDEFER